jgi:hypothetical protein
VPQRSFQICQCGQSVSDFRLLWQKWTHMLRTWFFPCKFLNFTLSYFHFHCFGLVGKWVWFAIEYGKRIMEEVAAAVWYGELVQLETEPILLIRYLFWSVSSFAFSNCTANPRPWLAISWNFSFYARSSRTSAPNELSPAMVAISAEVANKTLVGAHCKFLNIGCKIKKVVKLWGG